MNLRNQLALTKEILKQNIPVKNDHICDVIDALIAANDLIEDLDSSYWNANNDEDYKCYSKAISKIEENRRK